MQIYKAHKNRQFRRRSGENGSVVMKPCYPSSSLPSPYLHPFLFSFCVLSLSPGSFFSPDPAMESGKALWAFPQLRVRAYISSTNKRFLSRVTARLHAVWSILALRYADTPVWCFTEKRWRYRFEATKEVPPVSHIGLRTVEYRPTSSPVNSTTGCSKVNYPPPREDGGVSHILW